jgi:hypothetical protein
MADDKKVSRKKTKGRKFGTLAARLRYLYGAEAKTFSLNGMKELKDGMKWSNRACTDVLCLIIFLTVMLLLFIISVYSVYKGDIQRVLSGVDAKGNQCGSGEMNDYPKVFFA